MEIQIGDVLERPEWLPPSRGRVLVVDDDQAILEALAHLLREEGFQVYEASNGVEALGVLLNSQTPPDLILLDMQMPQMNGAEVLEQLEKNEAWRHIPVALLSASHQRSESPLMVANLTKPVELEEILSLGYRYATHRFEAFHPPGLKFSC